jgi:hypothetical protein
MTEPSPPFGGTGAEKRDVLWCQHVVNAFPVIGDEGIPINESAYAVRQPVSNRGYDHATVTVPNEDNVLKFVLVEKLNDRFNRLGQSDVLHIAWTIAFHRGCMHDVARRSDRFGYGFELVTCMPRPVYEHIGTHVELPPDSYDLDQQRGIADNDRGISGEPSNALPVHPSNWSVMLPDASLSDGFQFSLLRDFAGCGL